VRILLYNEPFSWHVENRDNREKVRKDEEEAKIHQERAHATKTQSVRVFL
jgi:hypothetical protein